MDGAMSDDHDDVDRVCGKQAGSHVWLKWAVVLIVTGPTAAVP